MPTRAQRKAANLAARPGLSSNSNKKAAPKATTQPAAPRPPAPRAHLKNEMCSKQDTSRIEQTGRKGSADARLTALGVSGGGASSIFEMHSSAAETLRHSAPAQPSAPFSSTTSTRKEEEQVGDRIVEAEFIAGATQLDQFPPPAFSEIAFAGRSNVGKSSLMNCLTGRRGLVRTSSTPGCTRQVSWFRSTSDDKSIVDLVDLPGYGYAKRSKTERKHWADLIGAYLLQRPTLRGVVLLIDVRRGVEPDDLELIKMLSDPADVSRPPLEITIVATKLDKLRNSEKKLAVAQIAKALQHPVIGFSSHDGTGRTALWRRLRRIAGVGLHIQDDSTPATTES